MAALTKMVCGRCKEFRVPVPGSESITCAHVHERGPCLDASRYAPSDRSYTVDMLAELAGKERVSVSVWQARNFSQLLAEVDTWTP